MMRVQRTQPTTRPTSTANPMHRCCPALARLFGGAAPRAAAADGEVVQAPGAQPAPSGSTPAAPSGPDTAASLAAEARAHYDRAIAAQRSGDWARYGEELRLLGDVLERMRAR